MVLHLLFFDSMNFFKSLFADILGPYISEFSREELINLIEIPPQGLWADLAFPCFWLTKTRWQSPVQIAQSIASLMVDGLMCVSEAKGPYINIIFSPSFVLEQLLTTHNQQLTTNNTKTILIESPSPNTNKPLHLGHVRNMCLWNSLSKIVESAGYKVTKVEVINDRGIHICKSMLSYKLRGNNAEPDKKSDHFVGDRYVRYATEEEKDPSLKEQAQEMLMKREAGDPEIKALWAKMNTRAIDGMAETYKRYGTHIDDATLESNVYMNGKDVAERGLKSWVFVHDPKGNIALPIPTNDDKMSYFVVLRSDGTTLYATQDLALVDARFQTYQMDKMVYVVGNEQDDYFRALFKCFKGLWYPFADQCYHLSYGMIELPNGKMKSRTGNVVDADELIEDLHQTSFEEIKKRYPDLDDVTAHTRAEQIALWAINFYMLKIDPAKWFVFDPAESLSFEGETGPYVQYTYARCAAILRKGELLRLASFWAKWNVVEESQNILWDISTPLRSAQYDATLCTLEEKSLALHLIAFQDYLDKAVEEYKPSTICRYAIELCQHINSYYQSHHIIDESNLTQTSHRIEMIRQAQQYLWQAMDLVCVPRVEVM